MYLNWKMATSSVVRLTAFLARWAVGVVFVTVSTSGCMDTSNQSSTLKMRDEKGPIEDRMTESAPDYASLFDVDDQTAEMLIRWSNRATDGSRQVKITLDEAAIAEVGDASGFDCTPYVFTKDLQDAITSSRRLDWLKIGADSGDVAWLQHVDDLQGLSLLKVDLRGVDLSKYDVLQNLRWLDLSFSGVTSHEVAALPKLKQLRVLWLDGRQVDDQVLAAFSGCSQLRALSLDHSRVTDSAVVQISESFPDIEYLSVFAVDNLTDSSVDYLVRLKHLKWLNIGLSGLCQIPVRTEAVSRLQQELPQCAVYYGD
jgi:hypothetical protein